ncbi:hypothetical protein Nepgr_032302 [Nepenthes gracilis]|uniref:Uncharacterized protein n=1 Tax=Nepenthes gracilis TaxID=150966 RepID=A0AAD3TJQ6_NEPGR|nr:hypothetical protein Nepgr_032302 [Nepenthes gracilis]
MPSVGLFSSTMRPPSAAAVEKNSIKPPQQRQSSIGIMGSNLENKRLTASAEGLQGQHPEEQLLISPAKVPQHSSSAKQHSFTPPQLTARANKIRINLHPTKHSTLNKIRSHFHHQTRDPISFISCNHPTNANVRSHPSRKLNPRKTTSKFTVAEIQQKKQQRLHQHFRYRHQPATANQQNEDTDSKGSKSLARASTHTTKRGPCTMPNQNHHLLPSEMTTTLS